jgi:co-chaperonin GroES (HSP10)
MISITPLRDNVLVTQNEANMTTASGIVLQGATETVTATVIAHGPDVEEVKVGDVIYVDWAKCKPVKVNSETHAIVSVKHIVAVVEND